MLAVREWLAPLLLLFTIGFVTVVCFVGKYKERRSAFTPPVTVRVVGEVFEEQKLLLSKHATVLDVLSKIPLGKLAAIEKLSTNARLRDGQILVIPKEGCLSVYVKGAVAKEGIVYLKEGDTFRDLGKLIHFTPDADQKAFKRKRRKLKDGEVIEILRR